MITIQFQSYVFRNLGDTKELKQFFSLNQIIEWLTNTGD